MKMFHGVKSAVLTISFRGDGQPGIKAKGFLHLEKEQNQKFSTLSSNENAIMLFKADIDTTDDGL